MVQCPPKYAAANIILYLIYIPSSVFCFYAITESSLKSTKKDKCTETNNVFAKSQMVSKFRVSAWKT